MRLIGPSKQPGLGGAVSQERDAEATPSLNHTPRGPAKALPAATSTIAIDMPKPGQSSRPPNGRPECAEDDQRCRRHIDPVDDPVARPGCDSGAMNAYTATNATAKPAASARR